MKHRLALLISLSLTAGLIAPAAAALKANAKETLSDTGLDYTESTEIIDSCDSGYTSSLWINTAPGKNWTTSVTHYSLLLICIGGYSSGMGNTDMDFDEAFFKGLEGTLDSARTNGVTVGLRFRYDNNGTTNPEPASFEQVEKHINQIAESGLLEEYSDVISFVETGFVGSWGEQWGGKYTDIPHKALVLDKFLKMVPDPIPVLVRTPNIFRQWLSDQCGIKISASDMSYNIEDPEKAKMAKRVGLYNDGYMGSDSDLGTFSDRKGETAWLASAPSYGGEFSGDDGWRLKYTTWQPENALKEMYLTDLLRINGNIYKTKTASKTFDTEAEAQAKLDEIQKLYSDCGLGSYDFNGSITDDSGKFKANWKWIGYDDITFDSMLDNELGVSCDNSAFYGENVWTFIRTHLGYRFVVRNCDMTSSAAPGETLELALSIENTGFSEAPESKETEILLTDGNAVYTLTADTDLSELQGAEKTYKKISAALPKTLHGGNWNVYLRISNKNDDAKDDAKYCTKLANKNIEYDSTLGANLIGSINVEADSDEPAPEYKNERPTGEYFEENKIELTENDKTDLINGVYNFTEDGHYGFTFLYKIEDVTAPIQLGNWYTGFTVNGSGYSSAYTTYGINTHNQVIEEDGIYALHIPFYGCAFNCTVPTSGQSSLNTLSINDSRNYWSSDTFTSLNGVNASITPLGVLEGGLGSTNVTLHLDSGDLTICEDSIGFEDKLAQNIENKKLVPVLSLLTEKVPESITDENGNICKLIGFTTKKNDKNYIIDENFPAIGSIGLYPYYEIDSEKTNFNSTISLTSNGKDRYGIRYIVNDDTMTASAGDGSAWENNSGLADISSVVIPAKIKCDDTVYAVTSIGANAFSGNTALKEVIIPNSVTNIGKNAFYKDTVITVYENSPVLSYLKDEGYTVKTIPSKTIWGDVDANGVFNADDASLLKTWLLGSKDVVLADGIAGDVIKDDKLNVFDLIAMKRHLVK